MFVSCVYIYIYTHITHNRNLKYIYTVTQILNDVVLFVYLHTHNTEIFHKCIYTVKQILTMFVLCVRIYIYIYIHTHIYIYIYTHNTQKSQMHLHFQNVEPHVLRLSSRMHTFYKTLVMCTPR